MHLNNIYSNLDNESNVPDPNGILNLKILKAIGKIVKTKAEDVSDSKLDDIDLSNLLNWLNNYNLIYSYRESENKLSKKWENIFENIDKQKGKEDIMGLVEIAIGRLLQNEFEKKGYNVRVRKTTNFDDITSGLDYIVEYFNSKGKLESVLGVDFTVSEKQADSLAKNFKIQSYPSDYKKYYEKKYAKKLHNVSRVVMTLNRDLAYSFTNNFFTEVLEKGNLLDSEDIETNFEYAIDDLKDKVYLEKKGFTIGRVLSNTNSKVFSLLNNFDKNDRK